jgi:Fur family iron response transcriptional regulator
MYGFNGNVPARIAGSGFKARSLLERFGLRATRQRLGLARILFGQGDRHLTADALAEVGLVRSLPIEGAKTVFDTNTSDHSHFYFEDTGAVCDIALDSAAFAEGIVPPEGYEIARIDIVVRLRPKGSAPARPKTDRAAG